MEVYTGHLNGIKRCFSISEIILCNIGGGELDNFPTLNQFCEFPVSVKQLLTFVTITVLGVRGSRRLSYTPFTREKVSCWGVQGLKAIT